MQSSRMEMLQTDTAGAVEMTEHDLKTVTKAFKVFSDFDDKTNTDLLSADCLPLALRAMKLIPSEAQIEKYENDYFDTRKQGIDQETFLAIAKDCWMDEVAIENAVWNAFAVFDEFQAGKLTPEVMRSILSEYGEPIPEEDAEFILKKSVNKDHLVLYPLLVSQWKKINIFPKPKKEKKESKEKKPKQKKNKK